VEIHQSLECGSALSKTISGGGENAVGFQVPNESFVKDFLKKFTEEAGECYRTV